jgi:hypothetical protein
MQAYAFGVVKEATGASKRISYTRLREIIKETISSIGLDPKQYSTHSLRSGGALFMETSQGNVCLNFKADGNLIIRKSCMCKTLWKVD